MLMGATEVRGKKGKAALLPPTKLGKPMLHRATRRITNLRQQQRMKQSKAKTIARSRTMKRRQLVAPCERHDPGELAVRERGHRRMGRARQPRCAPSKAPTTAPPPRPNASCCAISPPASNRWPRRRIRSGKMSRAPAGAGWRPPSGTRSRRGARSWRRAASERSCCAGSGTAFPSRAIRDRRGRSHRAVCPSAPRRETTSPRCGR